MATDLKYGQVPLVGIPDDEPIFIIRAQDKASVGAIQDYFANAEVVGVDDDFLVRERDVTQRFRDWQETNADRVKVPD